MIDYLTLLFSCLTQMIVCRKIEFYSRLNYIHGYGGSIIEIAKNYTRNSWFKEQYGSWNSEFSVPFAEILTRRGYAFAFNVINSSDLYNTNE